MINVTNILTVTSENWDSNTFHQILGPSFYLGSVICGKSGNNNLLMLSGFFGCSCYSFLCGLCVIKAWNDSLFSCIMSHSSGVHSSVSLLWLSAQNSWNIAWNCARLSGLCSWIWAVRVTWDGSGGCEQCLELGVKSCGDWLGLLDKLLIIDIFSTSVNFYQVISPAIDNPYYTVCGNWTLGCVIVLCISWTVVLISQTWSLSYVGGSGS